MLEIVQVAVEAVMSMVVNGGVHVVDVDVDVDVDVAP